jgi:glycosyltransferase involved in cell wall biosynthesis
MRVQNIAYSVIIPTIGDREEILRVVNDLMAQTLRPTEILIIVPSAYRENFLQIYGSFNCSIVKIFYSPFKGQVKQRIYGFKYVSTDIILQIDDDVVIENRDLLNNLIVFMNSKIQDNKCTKISVAPLMKFINKNEEYKIKNIFFSYFKPRNRFVARILASGGGSYPTGAFGSVDHCPDSIESEWLPGGFVLSHIHNLNFKNFYPFKGRAHGEDILDSIEKRRRGGRLYICLNIQLGLPEESICVTKKMLYRQFIVAILVNRKNGIDNYFWAWLKFLVKKVVYGIR